MDREEVERPEYFLGGPRGLSGLFFYIALFRNFWRSGFYIHSPDLAG
jgi:hypothetical protein